MSSQSLCCQSIEHLSPLIARKEVSPVEITGALLERINTLDPLLKAYITVLSDEALKEARRCEAEIVAGNYRGPLHGIPVALKDLYDTAAVKTTAASKIMAERVPVEDATSVARLRQAGAIILGKCNLHEFAYGVTGTSSYFGPSRNPWNRERIPGGSSGGSGAAVAADLCIAATGSDTGGSIRIPSALCGIVGLKPTFGRISCHGLVPLSWSLDHAGPMTKTVFDAAVMLKAMAGWDVKDPVTSRLSVSDYPRCLDGDIKGLRIAVDPVYAFDDVSDEVKSAFHSALGVLKGLQGQIMEIELPGAHEGHEAALTILMSEATSYHEEWLKARPDDYQADVRARLENGFAFRGIDYGRARHLQYRLIREFELLFERVDLLAMPMCGITAPLIDAGEIVVGGRTAPFMKPLTLFTRLFNLTGLPAISIPCGFTADHLPVGLQLVGRAWDEATVLRVARAYEKATNWGVQRPPLD